MPATGNTAARGRNKVLITALLMIGLLVGLAACRGFFGQAPIALLVFTPFTDEEVPITVDFDISGSNDPDGTIASYDLDYGDGTAHATGTDVTDALSHKYNADGAFVATLTITDNDGRIGMDTVTITIGGAMITFASDRGGDYDIWRMSAGGGTPNVVLNTVNDELFPDLIKGLRDMVAYAAEDGTSWNIWKMTVSGSSNYQLTTQTPSNQIEPSWSYQASKIAYTSNAAQTPSSTTWEIYTMNADGSSQAKLTTQSPSWAIAPAYSPTSDDMVFVSGARHDGTVTNGGSAIIKRTAGGVLSTLYDSSGNDGNASPDMSGASTTPLNLPSGMISKPAWSPDGLLIAFSTDKDGAINIYVVGADGTGPQTLEAYVNSLLTAAGEVAVTPGTISSTDDEFCPYWLEDESGLVFVREETGGNYNLYKVSFTTGLVTQLTSSTSANNVIPAAKR
jgi:Tol biopolymer transport system component